MPIETVAILSPGEMGAAVGGALHRRGLRVITALDGRGAFTLRRAAEAGFRDAGSLNAVLDEADLVLSILPPEHAPAQAERVAAAMKTAGRTPPYADLNAVSPDTSRAMQRVIEAAGAVYLDGGIVGSPPGKSDKATRIFVSGRQAPMLDALNGPEIDIRQCGPEIGRGSAVKMCYAGITKGTSALHAALLIAAEKLGVADELHEELAYSCAALYKRMETLTTSLPATAGRYMGEMREIAATMEAVGVTPNFHIGSLELYDLLTRTPFASEIRETVDRSRTMRETVRTAAEYVTVGRAAE
jgi:3-hydroxyisobutyrate dehydrogenase-like beta-hydroxyacid dehydrogenase